MLAFPLALAQAHLEQHHPTLGEIYHVLAFPNVQTRAHLRQHHPTVGES